MKFIFGTMRAKLAIALMALALVAMVTPASRLAAPSHLAALVVDAAERARPSCVQRKPTRAPGLTDQAHDHPAGAGVPVVVWNKDVAALVHHRQRIPAAANQAGASSWTRDQAAGTVLDALLVASANDAAVVAAEAISGSEPTFADEMNRVAKRLGMTSTRFANASGLPASPQFTTARDMAVLARYLWQRFPGRTPAIQPRRDEVRRVAGSAPTTRCWEVTAGPGA